MQSCLISTREGAISSVVLVTLECGFSQTSFFLTGPRMSKPARLENDLSKRGLLIWLPFNSWWLLPQMTNSPAHNLMSWSESKWPAILFTANNFASLFPLTGSDEEEKYKDEWVVQYFWSSRNQEREMGHVGQSLEEEEEKSETVQLHHSSLII